MTNNIKSVSYGNMDERIINFSNDNRQICLSNTFKCRIQMKMELIFTQTPSFRNSLYSTISFSCLIFSRVKYSCCSWNGKWPRRIIIYTVMWVSSWWYILEMLHNSRKERLSAGSVPLWVGFNHLQLGPTCFACHVISKIPLPPTMPFLLLPMFWTWRILSLSNCEDK